MQSSDLPGNSFYFYDYDERYIKVKTHPFDELDSQRHYFGGKDLEWCVARKPFKNPKHTPPFGLVIQIKDDAHKNQIIASLFSAACGAESIGVLTAYRDAPSREELCPYLDARELQITVWVALLACRFPQYKKPTQELIDSWRVR